VTGVDLVRAQVRVAAEVQLPFPQDTLALNGHAIEARVYAEDAARNFLPQAGDTVRVEWPRLPFVRVDAGVESGDRVPVHYDPILAKVIAHGADRSQALKRLASALAATRVHGVITNLPFLRALALAREVERGSFDTEWIEREFLAGFAALATAPAPDLVLAAAALTETFGGGPRSNGTNAAPEVTPGDAFRAGGRWRQPGLV
jgi:acetyl/propionyl-CoA carboxylase alpha subunit